MNVQQLEEATIIAAYKIVKALRVFKNEPPHIRAQCEHIVQSRVQRMLSGEKEFVDLDCVTEIQDTGQAEPINTSVTERGDETV